MKWLYNGEEYTDAGTLAQEISENIDEDVYDEMLDDCYGEIEICGYSYAASIALYRVDPIAYRCGFSDYCDSLYSDIKYSLERMDNGDSENFYGNDVECVDDEMEDC